MPDNVSPDNVSTKFINNRTTILKITLVLTVVVVMMATAAAATADTAGGAGVLHVSPEDALPAAFNVGGGCDGDDCSVSAATVDTAGGASVLHVSPEEVLPAVLNVGVSCDDDDDEDCAAAAAAGQQQQIRYNGECRDVASSCPDLGCSDAGDFHCVKDTVNDEDYCLPGALAERTALEDGSVECGTDCSF